MVDVGAGSGDVYCRHCGVRLRHVLGHWFHVKRLGPLACPGAEPEAPIPAPEDESGA